MRIKDHYDNHLGNIYSWMTGNFEEKQRAQQAFFVEHGLIPNKGKVAVDLGAGHGLQSVSLAKLGFEVHAVDFNHQLLAELQQNSLAIPIAIVEDDILNFLEHSNIDAELIVCMGDTLTHLESVDRVETLIQLMMKRLADGGKVVLSYRDLTRKLVGEQRFIPVRSDDSKILTCFLEYFPSVVMVHDILHEKINGEWVQKVSAYPKLRLDESMVMALLTKNGFQIRMSQTVSRMIHIIAAK